MNIKIFYSILIKPSNTTKYVSLLSLLLSRAKTTVKSKFSVAVACFLPGRAKDLSAPLQILSDANWSWSLLMCWSNILHRTRRKPKHLQVRTTIYFQMPRISSRITLLTFGNFEDPTPETRNPPLDFILSKFKSHNYKRTNSLLAPLCVGFKDLPHKISVRDSSF